VVPIVELLDEREHLLSVACRSFGSGSTAESVIVETYRRWYALSDTERVRIASPRSWLAVIAGEIASARLAHSTGDHDAGPDAADAKRAVSRLDGVLGMAPRMDPGYAALAGTAPRILRARQSRPTTSKEHDALIGAVRDSCAMQDAGMLTSLLCPDATAVFDGGGRVRAPVRPAHGSGQVARCLLTALTPHPRTTVTAQSVNGRTGLVVRCDHRVAAVLSLDITDHRVAQVWAVLNPEKLRRWNRHVDPMPAA
jgi:RNA polymerase sigma-70 factor (ECF subfamily)